METKYKILKKYETPSFTIDIGVIKTIDEWKHIFRDLINKDFDIKKDWFELVERYCGDQFAQIDCRKTHCIHNRKGCCLNFSPSITLNSNGLFLCWTFQEVK